MTQPKRQLIEILPSLARELSDALVDQDRSDLAQQISNLPIIDRCRCDKLHCATFFTNPEATGPFGPGLVCVEVEVARGWVVLDTVAGAIHCIEVLYRPDVRVLLVEAVP